MSMHYLKQQGVGGWGRTGAIVVGAGSNILLNKYTLYLYRNKIV